MGRNLKPGITFYRMDSDHITNKKVRLLMNEFDSDGYYVWQCLLSYAYGKWGYYFDMRDPEDLEYFSTEYCKKKINLVKEIIQGCLRRGLFDRTVFDSFGILTCVMMQEAYIIATTERRKKGSIFELQSDWLLLDFGGNIPGNISILPGNKSNLPGEQSDSSREQSTDRDKTKTIDKTKDSLPGKPAPGKKVGKGKNEKEQETEPHWEALVKIWFDFNVEKFLKNNPGANPEDGKPSFKGSDPRDLKQIVVLLRKRAEAQNKIWTAETAAMRLRKFLDAANQEDWLSSNFLLNNLLKQFDKVILQNATNGNKNRETGKDHSHRAVITGTATSAGTF